MKAELRRAPSITSSRPHEHLSLLSSKMARSMIIAGVLACAALGFAEGAFARACLHPCVSRRRWRTAPSFLGGAAYVCRRCMCARGGVELCFAMPRRSSPWPAVCWSRGWCQPCSVVGHALRSISAVESNNKRVGPPPAPRRRPARAPLSPCRSRHDDVDRGRHHEHLRAGRLQGRPPHQGTPHPPPGNPFS